ncbi:MAG: DUF4212 domain-containing protein [Gammaproteobacteria bacterium]
MNEDRQNPRNELNAAREAHWPRTRRLMFLTLGVWFVFSYLVHWFADALNGASFLGFPLGFYMAAQGSLIVFVVLLFWFAAAQDKIDRECGVQELDDKPDVEKQDHFE